MAASSNSSATYPRANDFYMYFIRYGDEFIYSESGSIELNEKLNHALCEKLANELVVVEAHVTNMYYPDRWERSEPIFGSALAIKLQDPSDVGWPSLTKHVL